MKSPRDVIIRPVVSEKSYAGLESNRYTFLVAPGANNTEIKEAIQQIWGVSVTSVRTLNRKGKVKRRRFTMGKRADEKRAERERELRAGLASAEKRLDHARRAEREAERSRKSAEREVESLRARLERLRASED